MARLVINFRKLRTLREALGWTQGELSYHSGIQRSTISKIETGARPNIRTTTLSALAGALGVATDDLIFSARRETRFADDEYTRIYKRAAKALESLSEEQLRTILAYIDFLRSRGGAQ